MTTEEARKILRELDEKTLQRLKAKAEWEGMTLTGVLKEWGDPREW